MSVTISYYPSRHNTERIETNWKEMTYHGLELSLSNCSNINSMQASINDLALKPSDNSYISETFSTEISLKLDNNNSSDQP